MFNPFRTLWVRWKYRDVPTEALVRKALADCRAVTQDMPAGKDVHNLYAALDNMEQAFKLKV